MFSILYKTQLDYIYKSAVQEFNSALIKFTSEDGNETFLTEDHFQQISEFMDNDPNWRIFYAKYIKFIISDILKENMDNDYINYNQDVLIIVVYLGLVCKISNLIKTIKEESHRKLISQFVSEFLKNNCNLNNRKF